MADRRRMYDDETGIDAREQTRRRVEKRRTQRSGAGSHASSASDTRHSSQAESVGKARSARHTSDSPDVHRASSHENTAGEKRSRRQSGNDRRFEINGGEEQLSFFSMFLLGSILVLLVVFLVLPDATRSDTENRSLQTLPIPTQATVSDGRFQAAFTDYVDDQFPFRDIWVSIQVTVSGLLGQIESNDVFKGHDGYLIQDFTMPEESSATDAITRFVGQHSNLKTYALLSPTAVSVLSDKLPLTANPDDQSAYIDSQYARLSAAGVTTIDVRDEFISNKDNGVFYHSDHHWTTFGSYLAFRTAAKSMGINADMVAYQSLTVSNSFDGVLKSKSGYFLNPSDELQVYVPADTDNLGYTVTYVDESLKVASPYKTDALNTRNAYEVFEGGNHSLVRTESAAETTKVLLLVKDSYANSMLPFLAPLYSKVVMVDPRYYYDDLNSLIETEKVTDVLFLYNATTYSEDVALSSVIGNE